MKRAKNRSINEWGLFGKAVTVLLLFAVAALHTTCRPADEDDGLFPAPDAPKPVFSRAWDSTLTKEAYYDKLLGMLAGAAIGDAMGAPTEMWHRSDIAVQFGYVDSLDMVLREGSPEGPWEDNLPGGSTTDDTRWKYLIGRYLIENAAGADSLDARNFAGYLVSTYVREMEAVKAIDAFAPEPLERQIMHMAWLQEWAKVAKPYQEQNLDGYSYALNRFYGGEMSCAGMLYTPAVGAFYPAQPEIAYREAYRLGLFDLGYARDISALTAAMVSVAMKPGIQPKEIGIVAAYVDPLRYHNSRLVGRLAFGAYRTAIDIAYRAKQEPVDPEITEPVKLRNWKRDPIYYRQVQKAYEMLDEHLQDIPFHAAEINLINLTALEFSEGDFSKAIEFVVNYGRDNDTVAAVTGAILGAYWGYNRLPQEWKTKALKINREKLGLDLEVLARGMADAGYRGGG
ncbi:MAG TPA: ADP-ribosylglycohydrolase family protein [Flavilitoribacter sp.]|nr:ADP-ribosylglycohydrolase family protein [Flavilitoribacter sp.]